MPTGPTTQMIDDRFCYGDREHAQYMEHGYCLFDHFLSEAGLAECSHQIDRMLDQLHANISPEWIIAGHCLERWIWELATETKILDMIERQIGPNIVFWSSHLLCKPPGQGRVVPWHQDAREWPNVIGNFGASVWIPFDDVDNDSGTMTILPGWHNKEPLPQIPRGGDRDDFYADIDPAAFPENLDEIKVDYVLQAGQAAIHHVMTPHTSMPNSSSRWRRVLIFRYIASDGELGPGTYYDYRTNEPFDRVFCLVRGEDDQGRGLPRSPFK